MDQMELASVPQSTSETENMVLDLGAPAQNHAPTSEVSAPTLLKQPVQETPDSRNHPNTGPSSEMHLLQDKAPGGDGISLINDAHLRHRSLHRGLNNVSIPNPGVEYAHPTIAPNAGQHSATLSGYGAHQHTSVSIGDPSSGQFMTQSEEHDPEAPRIQAYAKLEFDDGEFYMNTYSVELGRDLEAARLASEWEQEESNVNSLKRRRPSTSSEEVSQASNYTAQEDERHMAGSVISESGGIIGPDAQDSYVRKKSKFSKSKSATSSSQQLSRKSSMDFQNAPMASSSFIDASTLHHADPEACPLIRIHPPATGQGVPTSHKGISRRHVKIAFNFEKHVFELIILGRNGAFVDELWYKEGDTLALKNGSLIQIGGVRVRFLLPDMSSGEGGAEITNHSSSPPGHSAGKLEFSDLGILERGLNKHGLTLESSSYESSFAYSSSDDAALAGVNPDMFSDAVYSSVSEGEEINEEEDGHEELNGGAEVVESVQGEETPELEELEAKPRKVSARAKRKDETKAKVKQLQKGVGKSPSKIKSRSEPQSNLGSIPEPTAPVVKRKGPGRPPKNGIMSKREQKLLAKQAQEAAKAEEQRSSEEKVMDTNQDEIPAPLVPTKRKYTKRKNKDLKSEQHPVRESTEHPHSLSPERNSRALPKVTKEKKPVKPPRSPSPVYDRATLTEEQLARPNASYQILIHQVLSEAGTDGMSLPQIYRAIERRYPYYKLEVQTVGWQSSVRHNLSQHEAFVKVKREGKGWLWGVDPLVPIEKEKKRKAASPPTQAQHNSHQPQMMHPPPDYQHAQMMHAQPNFQQPHMIQAQQNHPQPPMMPNSYPFPGMPVPNGHMPPHMVYPSYKMPDQTPYPQPSSFVQGVGPNGLPMPLAHGLPDSSSTYQSPYQPAPPIQSSQPPLPRQALIPVSYEFDGQCDPGTAQPPLSVSENSSSNPPCPAPASAPSPSPSPAPQSQPPGPQPTPGPNPSQEILQAVEQFKTFLVGSMKDHKHGKALVNSAINRVLGYQTSSSLPGNEEDPQEKTIMQIFSGMLEDLNKKSSEFQRQASQP
jgi:hypothetical protein